MGRPVQLKFNCEPVTAPEMTSWLFLLCCLACASALQLEDIADVKRAKSREPKLFFVSSSSTTSTISTHTICYKSTTTAVGTCGKRRKRTISVDTDDQEVSQMIKPSYSIGDDKEGEFDSKIESGAEDAAVAQRDGRFLLYWLTTTSTSTTTIYTGTSTVASITCTPSGFSYSLC